MPSSARLFVCARCRAQVIVCRRCDRGQIYCGGDCSLLAHQTSMRVAGQRYQRTRHGRFAHAERMRRYRSRNNKVTHQGSAEPAADALLALTSTTSATVAVSAHATPEAGYCHFCHSVCAGFVRLAPLRRRVFRDVRTATDCTGSDHDYRS
jgi:hypothetical protein